MLSYYACHHTCIRDILCHIHAYRIDRGDNIAGIQRRRGRGLAGDSQAIAPKEEEKSLEELPECPNHRPTSFLRGKPRSIISLSMFYKILLASFMIDALGYKS